MNPDFLSSKRPLVAAYYFPNYHPDVRNAKVHGPGWSEWELVRKAGPRFPGHRQPLVPTWGYQDESDPAVMERKIDAASRHGVDCFLFDWYYYDDGPFLERCLEEGFLKASNVSELRFACMWANHDWVHIHPAKRCALPHVLYPGRVTPRTFDHICDLVIDRYFGHPSHLRIEGAPFFSIYDLGQLVAGFGSIDETRRAMDRFREKTVRAGFPGLHLNAIGWNNSLLHGEDQTQSAYHVAERIGCDSMGHYVWAHFHPLNSPEPRIDFPSVEKYYFQQWDQFHREHRLPVFPNVTMGWDSTPRVLQSDVWDPTLGYPFTQVIGQNTPEAFRKALIEAQRRAAGIDGFSMVTLNAWNEWTEGSQLEPDEVHGYGYLEAVRDVFPPAGRNGIPMQRQTSQLRRADVLQP